MKLIKPAAALALILVWLLPVAAFAQVSGAAFQGFNSSSKDPVQIEADELEVIDAEAKAIFKGNVKVRQGSSTITTSRLVVEYVKGAGGQQNDIDRLIMSGGLVATSQDNTVSASKGIYQVARERIELEGKVVISQGENVATGCKLNANLKTNQAVLSACKGSGGRVSTVFRPGSARK